MQLTVLAATGATGRELVTQALARGHDVTALARDPSRITERAGHRLQRIAVDVRDPGSVRRVIGAESIVLSGLGVAKGDRAGVLTLGAHALIAAGPAHIVWLGAFGTGASAETAGSLTRTLLRLMGDQLTDKVTADTAVLRAGGSVFHADPLSDGPLSTTRRTVGLADAPHRVFPSRISRATVAAAMLDEAEAPRFVGQTALPLAHGPAVQRHEHRSTGGDRWGRSSHRLAAPDDAGTHRRSGDIT